MPRLVPPDFSVPDPPPHPRFRLRMLSVHDAVRDYDAVMSSRARLRGVLGSDWPREDLTLEQNLIDLAWHQKEFQRGSSYAWTVVDPEDVRTLGCVYLFPPDRPGWDGVAAAWVRDGCEDLEAPLLAHLRDWFARDWPLPRLAWPGRDQSWARWQAETPPWTPAP